MRKISSAFAVLLVIVSVTGVLLFLAGNRVITEKEAIEISEEYVKNSDIYVGMKAYAPPELVSVKKVGDGWEVTWKFTTRYMGHAPYSEIKLPAIDEHEMVVYMMKSGEIKKAICCGEYEVREWKK